MNDPEIHDAHLVVNGRRHPAGRLLTAGGQTHVISDYHGRLSAFAGPNPPASQGDLEIVPRSDVQAGRHLAALPEAELQPLPPGAEPQPTAPLVAAVRPPAVFEYHRRGMDQPHVIEFSGGRGVLDGHPLDQSEHELVLQNVRSGVATLRHKHRDLPQAMAKAERFFQVLAKEEEADPSEDLGRLEQLVAGHPDPKGAQEAMKSLHRLRRHIFEDRMVPGVGSKYAWEDHRAKQLPGVYGSLDLNDFKVLNDIHGHDAGDAAIRAFGRAARGAADEVGSQHLKLFRPGGDEFTMHAATPQHAHLFMRALGKRLADMPPVNGVHRVSMSAGLGPTFESADQALLAAKKQKFHPGTLDRKFKPGDVPNLAHSHLSGQEGPVQIDPGELPLSKLPEGTRIKLPEETPTAQLAPAPGK